MLANRIALTKRPRYETLLNGTDQQWAAGATSQLNQASGNFTILALIRYTVTPPTGYRIVDKYDGTTAGYLFGLNTSNYLALTLFSGGSNSPVTQTSGRALNDGQTHFVAAAVGRGGDLRLYVDGEKVQTASTVLVGSLDNTVNFTVGNGATLSRYFAGIIGEVQLINAKLTDDEILKISAFARKTGFRSGYGNGTVQAWYDWRNRGRDRSGNAYDLTPTNSPIIKRTR